MTKPDRQRYGLGSFIKKAARKVKKVIKSPLGKAALLGAGAYFAPTMLGSLGKGASLGARGAWWKGVPSFLGRGMYLVILVRHAQLQKVSGVNSENLDMAKQH